MDACLLLLAQSPQEGLGLLQTILSGGVPLICLAIAALCAIAFYIQLKRNNVLETDFRKKIESTASTELTRQEALLREMLTRDKEATETTSAAIQAVESYSHALKEQQNAFDAMKLMIESQAREIRELRDKVGGLEDAVRRFPNA